MKSILLTKTGSSDILKVSENEIPNPNEDEIQIEIKYCGVNYADILSRKGLYSWSPKRPYILGLEAAGEIVKKGKNIQELDIGDRIIYGGQTGGYAEYVNIHKNTILKAPDQYNWKECAAFGVNWYTSWIALHEIARVRRKEILLVHSAAGGVGTASIQLGKVFDMEVFGTTSQEIKKKRIEELGAYPLDYIDFDSKMWEMNKRPDCVIETVGGDVYTRSFKVLAPMGRVVLIGASGIKVNKWNPISLLKALKALPKANMSQILRQSKGFMGVHLGYLITKEPRKLRLSWNELIKTVTEFGLKPEIREDHIYPMSKAGDAHELIDNRNNLGKVLLDPSK